MPHTSERVRFPNAAGLELAGIIEWPRQPIERFAIFTHCFTCTKDLKAIVRISRRLAAQGIAVLRFDFTGLGDSAGDFSQTTFLDNQADLIAAADYLQQFHRPPQLLLGHSLGGAAAVACASQIKSVRGVVNLAAPSNTQHLADFLALANPRIDSEGAGTVVIGGRSHWIRKEMLDVLRQTNLPQMLAQLSLPLLIFFSNADETLPVGHALQMVNSAGGPTSLILLPGSDHLLVNHPADIPFIAESIAIWCRRYFSANDPVADQVSD